MGDRFQFGKNWQDFITRNFSEDRLETSKQPILRFLKMDNLNGLTFMDVGCGSGLHSLAALRAGAKSVVAFDYDPDSVQATEYLRRHVGIGESWSIQRGDGPNRAFMVSHVTVQTVYAWGVLHNTANLGIPD